MIAFDEAIALIDRNVAALGEENVPLGEAAGRVLAKSLVALRDAPLHPVATMDGYAVLDATTAPGQSMRVVGQSAAGAGFAGSLGPGEVVRIFTGAPMPHECDRCIAQEHAERDGQLVTFTKGYGPGHNVRATGSDFRAGDLLVQCGTRLGPRAMVAAAAADVDSVLVFARPRVVIVGTGDELAAPGTAFGRTYAIPDSVTFGVAAMAAQAGAIVAERLTAPDHPGILSELADDLIDHADLIVVTGGASVGERDVARSMFSSRELEFLFERVAMKPGKPVWLGRAGSKWVLGLPGNPTSAMTTARLLMLPLLARLQGRTSAEVNRWREMTLAGELPATGGRETFSRAKLGPVGLVPLSSQDSGAQRLLVQADWLIRRPAHAAPCNAGDRVTAITF